MTGFRFSEVDDEDVESSLALLEDALSADEKVLKVVAGMKPTRIAFAAPETGRRVMVEVGGGRLSFRLGGEDECDVEYDVMIEATEDTLARVIRGEWDADAADFTGRLRIRGSLAAAFTLRVKLLGLVQMHAAKIRVASMIPAARPAKA